METRDPKQHDSKHFGGPGTVWELFGGFELRGPNPGVARIEASIL